MNITEKLYDDSDLPLIAANTGADKSSIHALQNFAQTPKTATTTFGDEAGPLLLVRGSKSLRLDLAIPIMPDLERVAVVLLEGLPRVLERARANGFTEVLIRCDYPQLSYIAVKDFGFTEFGGELRKQL